jgi:hypothetical protein
VSRFESLVLLFSREISLMLCTIQTVGLCDTKLVWKLRGGKAHGLPACHDGRRHAVVSERASGYYFCCRCLCSSRVECTRVQEKEGRKEWASVHTESTCTYYIHVYATF